MSSEVHSSLEMNGIKKLRLLVPISEENNFIFNLGCL